MIPELGYLFLVSALFFTVIAVFLPLINYFTRQEFNFSITALSISTSLSLFLSLVILIYCFLVDDFSVRYIALNSNTELPIYFKLAAAWGGHEGSLLLWLVCFAFWISAYIFTSSENTDFTNITFSIANLVIFSFICFTVFTSNPFERILPVHPLQGSDLNPSLQDIAFTIHPPLLYMGYSGLVIPFSIALSAMLTSTNTRIWSSQARPWTLFSCSFLTAGIALGSWWAYYELGWGGWWFWDPVENAAFVPWLFSVALFHSLIATNQRNVFVNWSIMLSILAFASSLIGTFLVRSGVLTSVHAFALDPERGLFILGIFSFFVISSLLIYSFKFTNRSPPNLYTINSKEFSLLINNIFLVILAVSILFGTLFPLIYEAFTQGKQISVGAPYFNTLILPFSLILGLVQGLALILDWKETNNSFGLNKIIKTSIYGVMLLSLILLIIYESLSFILVICIFLFVWITSGVFVPVFLRTKSKTIIFFKRKAGVALSHLGMAIMILGIGVVTSHSFEREIILSPGESYEFEKGDVTFNKVEDQLGPNYFSKVASFKMNQEEIISEKRTYLASGQKTTEAGIKVRLLEDYYISLGENLTGETWSLKIQIKPFIRFIWLGAFFIMIGSFLSGRRIRVEEK
tara:strand:+ start:35651 stop:37546 length:1896 start_codon:yes stop_codon:yes gene_type:complete